MRARPFCRRNSIQVEPGVVGAAAHGLSGRPSWRSSLERSGDLRADSAVPAVTLWRRLVLRSAAATYTAGCTVCCRHVAGWLRSAEVLREHEGSLRVLFAAICDLNPVTMEHGGLANKLITFANCMA